VGFGIRHNLDVMQGDGITPQRILGVGGVTKNKAWLQIISDIANVNILIPKQQIGASYGDALIAGIGVNAFDGLDEIKKWIAYDQVFSPDQEKHRQYMPLYEVYRDLYEETRGLMRRLSALTTID
jgi:xylulokinase